MRMNPTPQFGLNITCTDKASNDPKNKVKPDALAYTLGHIGNLEKDVFTLLKNELGFKNEALFKALYQAYRSRL